MWAKTKTGGKVGFNKLYGWVDKLGPPVNRLSNKLGSEAFWPTTLDKECDKAARILKSFCKDGFYQEEEIPTADGPKSKQKLLRKIPTEVIRNAKGLAIFTTMRTGLWVSGAGGSGVLIGRMADGNWSPPSGIMLHTAGLGFLAGIDIYDCVLVINTQEALNAFSTVRFTLGGEISAVAGPVGVGGVLETEVHKRQAPIFTYLKSRGLYAGVQVDGTIVIERTDENETFYGERIGVKDILAGKTLHPPYEIRRLMETVKAAQGDTDVNESLLPSEQAPGDYEIEQSDQPGELFGIPDKEDPDPYGVLALQNAGLDIREAGTQRRPTSEQFEFNPSPTSPIYSTFRKSIDRSSFDGRSGSRRSSWRTSTISSVLEPKTPTMVDMCTQTDLDEPQPIKVPELAPRLPPRLPPRRQSRAPSPVLPDIAEVKVNEGVQTEQPAIEDRKGDEHRNEKEDKPEEKEKKEMEKEDEKKEEPKEEERKIEEERKEKERKEKEEKREEDSRPSTSHSNIEVVDLDDSDDGDDEEPVIAEFHQATTPQAITRARIIQVPKLIPPKLPPRNPFRNRSSNSNGSNDDLTHDASVSTSPVRRQSPPATPSLKEDDSSASSLLSIEGSERMSKGLDPFQPQGQKDARDEFHSPPESPVKAIPGGFN